MGTPSSEMMLKRLNHPKEGGGVQDKTRSEALTLIFWKFDLVPEISGFEKELIFSESLEPPRS